jgi:hypothetical protein
MAEIETIAPHDWKFLFWIQIKLFKEQFEMKISLLKYKVMAFKGQVVVRSKIVIDNTILV